MFFARTMQKWIVLVKFLETNWHRSHERELHPAHGAQQSSFNGSNWQACIETVVNLIKAGQCWFGVFEAVCGKCQMPAILGLVCRCVSGMS